MTRTEQAYANWNAIPVDQLRKRHQELEKAKINARALVDDLEWQRAQYKRYLNQ